MHLKCKVEMAAREGGPAKIDHLTAYKVFQDDLVYFAGDSFPLAPAFRLYILNTRFLAQLILVSILFTCRAYAASAEDIVITAQRETETANHTSIITVDDYTQNLADILNQSSGIYISQSYKEPTLSIRGFSNSQVKILVDGVPYPNLDIPTQLIEKIIVSRGPISSLYGNSAMGGVVNIITKKNFELTKISASYGSFSTTELTGQSTYSREPFKFYIINSYKYTNGRYTFSPKADPLYTKRSTQSIIKNNEQESYGGTLGAHYKQSDLSLSYSQNSRGIPGLKEHPTFHIHEKTKNYRLVLTNEHSWTHIQSQTKLYQQGIFTHYKDPEGEWNGVPYEDSTSTHSYGTECQFTYTEFDNYLPSLRLELSRERFDDRSIHKQRTLGTLSTSIDILLFKESLTLTPSLSQTYATELTQEKNYSLGVIYKLNPLWTLKSQAGTSFRYPKFEELYAQKGFVVGNPDLQAEKSMGGDIGLIFDNSKVKTEFTYFLYRSKNLIDYQLVSGFQYKPFNFQSTRTQGFEVDVKTQTFYRTRLTSSFTYQDIRDNDKNSPYYGNFIPSKPWIYGQNTFDYDVYSSHTLSYVFTFAKSRFVHISNTKKLPDLYSSDIRWNYSLSQNTKLQFDIRNLFNRNNVDVRDIVLPGRGYYLTLEQIL